jgi:hypothetical protein
MTLNHRVPGSSPGAPTKEYLAKSSRCDENQRVMPGPEKSPKADLGAFLGAVANRIAFIAGVSHEMISLLPGDLPITMLSLPKRLTPRATACRGWESPA